MNASILLVLLAVLGDDPPPVAPPPAPEGACQFIVDGEGIEKLILVQASSGKRYTVDVTALTVSLATGKYWVEQVTLKGGYSYTYSDIMERFALTPDAPYHFRPGELTPHVDAKRQGRLIKLDYRLTDTDGRRCIHTDYSSPPRFSVLKDGQEIASGSFEYG
jgi:hypothetical protein